MVKSLQLVFFISIGPWNASSRETEVVPDHVLRLSAAPAHLVAHILLRPFIS